MKRNLFLGSLLLIPLLLIGYGIARPSHSTERVGWESGRGSGFAQAQETYTLSQPLVSPPLNVPLRQRGYDGLRSETAPPFARYGAMDPDRPIPGRMGAMDGPGMDGGMMGASDMGRGMGGMMHDGGMGSGMGHGGGWGSLGGILGAIVRAIFGGGHMM